MFKAKKQENQFDSKAVQDAVWAIVNAAAQPNDMQIAESYLRRITGVRRSEELPVRVRQALEFYSVSTY